MTTEQKIIRAKVGLLVRTAMADNERAIGASGEELAGLQQQRTVLEQARAAQQTHIALELKTAWQLGRQGQLRVLLNQESPHTVARVLATTAIFSRPATPWSRVSEDPAGVGGTATAH